MPDRDSKRDSIRGLESCLLSASEAKGPRGCRGLGPRGLEHDRQDGYNMAIQRDYR